jgi:hypothetical protein
MDGGIRGEVADYAAVRELVPPDLGLSDRVSLDALRNINHVQSLNTVRENTVLSSEIDTLKDWKGALHPRTEGYSKDYLYKWC